MDEVRNHFLASAALTKNQNRRIHIREKLDLSIDLQHGVCAGEEISSVAKFLEHVSDGKRIRAHLFRRRVVVPVSAASRRSAWLSTGRALWKHRSEKTAVSRKRVTLQPRRLLFELPLAGTVNQADRGPRKQLEGCRIWLKILSPGMTRR